MKNISRRHFIIKTGGAGLGLGLGLASRGYARKITGTTDIGNFTPYILMEPDGSITIFNTKPEMGQGTFQSIPALIAEELEVSLDQVTIKQSNGEKELGNMQRAGGSASVRTKPSAPPIWQIWRRKTLSKPLRNTHGRASPAVAAELRGAGAGRATGNFAVHCFRYHKGGNTPTFVSLQ